MDSNWLTFLSTASTFISIMKHDIEPNDKKGYLSITSEQAYEWVKSGVWSLGMFQNWLDYVIRDAEDEARYGGC